MFGCSVLYPSTGFHYSHGAVFNTVVTPEALLVKASSEVDLKKRTLCSFRKSAPKLKGKLAHNSNDYSFL